MPSSLATRAMLPPAAWTISTASALNSGVNFRRLLVDMTDSFRARRRNHQVSVKPGQHQPVRRRCCACHPRPVGRDCVASFGFRGVVRHRVAGNWVKGYDTASVLRVDTTINNPRELRMPRAVSDSDRRCEAAVVPDAKGGGGLWRPTCPWLGVVLCGV